MGDDPLVLEPGHPLLQGFLRLIQTTQVVGQILQIVLLVLGVHRDEAVRDVPDHDLGVLRVQPDMRVTRPGQTGRNRVVADKADSLGRGNDPKVGIRGVLDEPAHPDFQAQSHLQQQMSLPQASEIAGLGRVRVLAFQTCDEALDLHVFPSHLFGELLEDGQSGHHLDGGGEARRRMDERHGERDGQRDGENMHHERDASTLPIQSQRKGHPAAARRLQTIPPVFL